MTRPSTLIHQTPGRWWFRDPGVFYVRVAFKRERALVPYSAQLAPTGSTGRRDSGIVSSRRVGVKYLGFGRGAARCCAAAAAAAANTSATNTSN